MTERPFYRQQFCNDFEAYCDSVREWDLDYRPLESGSFASERLSFGNSQFLFSHTKINRHLLQNGTIPKGLVTFGILANPGIKIHWRNADIKGDALFVFPPGGELNAISRADFSVFPLSLSEQKLNQVCTLLELPEFRTLTNNTEVFRRSAQSLFELRQTLYYIEHLLLTGSDSSRNIQFLQEIEHTLAVKLVETLAEYSQSDKRKSVRKRDVAINTAEAYIRENNGTSIAVPDLCSIANASQRMLEYAFRERYNMSPKAYIQALRINTARKQLQKANPYTDQVTQIARHNGFSHMGQFGAYYKKMFGERPSDTLKHRTP